MTRFFDVFRGYNDVVQVSFVDFEHISHLFVPFLLLTFNRYKIVRSFHAQLSSSHFCLLVSQRNY